jgi:anaerobic dimethyl sulfoxide reductase subunit B (iron-sulfur subunit)
MMRTGDSMEKQYGFYLDADRCTGCNACTIACRDKNNLPMGVQWRRTHETEGESNAFYITMSCNHCQNPPCVAVCPFGALEKRNEDGLVAVDAEKCRGCRKCINSCPYGSLYMIKESGKIGKCNGCMDMQNKGEAPACMSACPMRAVDFGPMEELARKYPDAVSVDLILRIDKNASPNFLVKPHRSLFSNP